MGEAKLALALALVVAALGLAACADDDGDEGRTTTGASKESAEPILIKTRLAPPNAQQESKGEVLSGSTIGDSAFCGGGTFADGPKASSGALVRTFRCSDGTLTITFTSTPPDVEQRSDWDVVKGLASFKGLSGGGRMRAVESSNGEARETFTGTVTR